MNPRMRLHLLGVVGAWWCLDGRQIEAALFAGGTKDVAPCPSQNYRSSSSVPSGGVSPEKMPALSLRKRFCVLHYAMREIVPVATQKIGGQYSFFDRIVFVPSLTELFFSIVPGKTTTFHDTTTCGETAFAASFVGLSGRVVVPCRATNRSRSFFRRPKEGLPYEQSRASPHPHDPCL